MDYNAYLTQLLNSTTWTPQDALKARQATTLATPSPGCVLDPVDPSSRPIYPMLYALQVEGYTVTRLLITE